MSENITETEDLNTTYKLQNIIDFEMMFLNPSNHDCLVRFIRKDGFV